MDVYFETQNGRKFCIELGYWDTVLEIKKKIEKYQRIPVPNQTLFFGNALEDHLDIGQCKILQNSHVVLFVLPDPNDNNDQVLQTEEQPPIIGDLIYGEDLPLTTEVVLNIRPFCPVQDSPVRNNDQSPPSDAAKDIIKGHQDSPVRNNEQTPPSDSVKENTNIQDSPVGKIILTLRVMPYSGKFKAAKNLHFITYKTYRVKMLRQELVQNELRDHLDRPQDGDYFFVHKGRVLNEDQSFEWNSVAHTDIVEIVPDPWLY